MGVGRRRHRPAGAGAAGGHGQPAVAAIAVDRHAVDVLHDEEQRLVCRSTGVEQPRDIGVVESGEELVARAGIDSSIGRRPSREPSSPPACRTRRRCARQGRRHPRLRRRAAARRDRADRVAGRSGWSSAGEIGEEVAGSVVRFEQRCHFSRGVGVAALEIGQERRPSSVAGRAPVEAFRDSRPAVGGHRSRLESLIVQ